MDVTQIGRFVVRLVKPHVDYIIDHDSNVGQLRVRLNELDNVKLRVLHKVTDAASRSQKIEVDVDEWLKRVEGITEEARKLLEAESHEQMCFHGLCTNFITRYNPSKNALALAHKMDDEIKKGYEFPSVAYTVPLQATTTTSKGYQAFASRTSIVTEILEEFKKENINMIGVFGMPGVGKSTFVHQVANQAKEEKLFDDKVGVAEVKQNPDVKSIQNKLALSFGLQLDKTQTIDEWQIILCNYMKDKKKKILIILDDIWEVLDLKTLGVEERYCKVLLTSRNGEILHSEMGTQKNFRLDVLNEEETWSFFERKVGDAVKKPDIREVATQIAERCAGLPILVETIAKRLRGKPIYFWNDTSARLNRSDGKGLLEQVYWEIELCYNQLDDEGLKSLFLISGMLWDEAFHLCYLLKCTMGLSLKLFEGIDTMEKAYDRLQSSVDKLKESSLLCDTDNNQFFKMHDLTRDVARKIAARDQHFLSFGYKNEVKEWPNKELLQNCAMMNINRINIPKLPQELECEGLHLFLLSSIDKSLQIPHNFFRKTKRLKVLDLTHLCIPLLPPSIKSLTSLQTLCLDQCQLGDITIVGELRNLEFLSFVYSKVKQLPKEMGNLTRLRSLDMSYCFELEVIYPDVIKSLTRLEELNMNNSFNKWETVEESYNINERTNASLSELKHLPNLTALGINIKDVNQLPINIFSEKLKHFMILIGDVWNWYAEYGISKTLKLKLSRYQLDQGLETILQRCEDLSLDAFDGVNNIVYRLDMDGFQRLKKLHVQNNPKISHVLHSNIGNSLIQSHAAFPNLAELSLCNLVSLENVCSGQLAVESFGQLKIIKVQRCPKLKNLFSLSTILHFLQLEEIEIEDCNNMKEIIVGEKEKQSEIEANDPIKFDRLQSLSLQGLPELTCFTSNAKLHETSTSSDPQQLFNDMVVFPKLEKLKLSSIPLGKYLWYGNYSARLSWIQNLTSLIVDGCDGLSFLCSSSMAINFVQLKNLEIRRCQNMVKIISTEEALGNLEKMDKMFSKLQTLKLEALGKLQIFCTSPTYIEFPCLQFLDIKDCAELGCFISESIRGKNVGDPAGYHLFDINVGFPNLKDLRTKGLHKLTTIWHTQLACNSFNKLTIIWVKSCSSLIDIIGPSILKRLGMLKKLYVESCESVQEVFSGDHDQSEELSCKNLLQVNINCCKSLKIVFPAPVARVLENLEMLSIFECEILELIVGKEDQMVGEIIPRFLFKRLTSVQLCELPQLRSFYPGMHTSIWPSLRKLWLYPSYEHENLAEEYSIFQQQQQHEHDQLGTPTKLPILLFQKDSFSHLEEFKLWFRDGLELPLVFLGIKRLYIFIERTASAVGVFAFVKKFDNLQLLELHYGTMKEIFINEEQHVFAHLKSLGIGKMEDLIHVWKENSNLAGPVFPNLENLKVGKCRRLKNIVSSAISFRNLVQLEVVECDGLKHLITCSVAKSLAQLQSISVENCQGMIEIVASDDDSQDIGDADQGNEITFSQLKDLKLSNLPNLKGFCSLNCNVKFSFFTTLSVTGCVEMKISLDGVLLNDSKHGGVASQITEEEVGG